MAHAATCTFSAVDLYLIHSPMRVDKRLDTWKAMETILKSGRARSIGVSNYGIHHLEELFANCTIRPSVNQVVAS
jgi:diketogulonate reductase-like aldo/keto reductase